MKELNFKKFGEGEPVIILHGLFGMLDNWQTFGRMLSEDYEVYLVDQRNHGSSPHTDEHNYKSMAEDLKEWMEDQDLESAHIIGHSMGGKTALTFALMYPELARSVVSIDMGVKKYEGSHERFFSAMFSLPIDEIQSRSEAEEHLRKQVPENAIRMFLMKNIDRNPEGGYRWKFNLQQLYDDYEGILDAIDIDAQYDKDVLIVGGEKSGYVKPDDYEGIRHFFPKAEITSLNTGHWVHAEKPKELLELIRNFLAGV